MEANRGGDGIESSEASIQRGRVLVTAPGFDPEGGQTGARLIRAGLEVRNAGPRGRRQPREVAQLAAGAVAAIASSDPFTEEVFTRAPELRVLARLGVGTDSVDVEAATRAGVLVTTTPGLNDETCAEHTLALLLATTRRVVEHDASVRRGAWDRGKDLTPWDVRGKQIGVVGYGRIGRSVVRKLSAFSAGIKVFDPWAVMPDEYACQSLDELLSWAEILTLHVPLNPQTRGMIGASELAALPKGAILVNTSRGGLVDERALLDSLRDGHLRAAAVDVFEEEPPVDPAWRQLPNVVLSPHIGGLSVEAIDAMARQCVDQVLQALDGKLPAGAVNPEALDRRPLHGSSQ